MLVAAAACPCPPLLVPEVASGAASELDALRAACADAVAVLAAARPDLLVVVGPDGQDTFERYAEGTTGSFRGFGVDFDVRLGRGPGTEGTLPPSLAVGAWLLDRTRWAAAPVEGLGVGEMIDRDRCRTMGGELAGSAGRVALLVMGDGSACRTVKAPGYLDDRAVEYDRRVCDALGAADIAALASLDESPARELKVSGRAPWQILAGAARGAGLAGRLLCEEAPYGVGYFVAAWS